MRMLMILCLALATGGCAMTRGGAPMTLAEDFDVSAYMGQWYVIAHIPYFAERGKLAPRVIYRPRDDGRMDDLYYYREAFDEEEKSMEGVAWVVDESQPARWKARFVWPFTFDYLVLKVDEDYQHAAVGHPSREYAWIFARSPEVDRATYDAFLAEFARQGYDTSRLVVIAQNPQTCPVPGLPCVGEED